LGYEHKFPFFPAFRFPKGQFPALDISESEFEHFADSHTTPGHQFKNQPIPGFHGSENDLVNGFFLKDIPVSRCFRPEKFPHHRRVTGITEILINVVTDEIEKSGELGIADLFGLALFPFGDFIQKSQDVI